MRLFISFRTRPAHIHDEEKEVVIVDESDSFQGVGSFACSAAGILLLGARMALAGNACSDGAGCKNGRQRFPACFNVSSHSGILLPARRLCHFTASNCCGEMT